MSDKNVLARDKRRYLLKTERALGAETHSYMPELSDQLQRGLIHRRDFLRQACLLGVSVGTATVMAGKLTGEPLVKAAHADGHGKPGGILKVSMAIQEMNDPATFSWTQPANVSRFIVEYLSRTRADNVTVPYLAERWETSDDLKTWVFHLNKGITWSNGDAFGADDVVHTINRWLDPEVGSSNLGLFDALVQAGDDGVKRGIPGAVEKVDDHTVKLNLKQAALAMPENFYNYPTAIVHRGFGVDYDANLSQNPIGTGALELESFEVGIQSKLRKKRDWWAGNFYLDGIDYFDHGEDNNAWLAAVASQQVHAIYQLTTAQIEAAERIPHLKVIENDTAQTGVMRFRTSEAPFDNKKVRQAVIAAMDNEQILQFAYKGKGTAAENHHVAPIHPEYAKLKPLKRDVELAKKLLADAGYPDGIDLTIANGDTEGPWMTDACAVMKQQVAEAGINVTINKMPTSQYWENWDKAPWGYTTWTHRALGTMVLSLAYRAGVAWNETAYDNPEFDAALNDAEATLDVNERRKKMTKVQQILQDDAIIPQPFWRKVYRAINKNVQGMELHPTFYYQFHNVWLDEA